MNHFLRCFAFGAGGQWLPAIAIFTFIIWLNPTHPQYSFIPFGYLKILLIFGPTIITFVLYFRLCKCGGRFATAFAMLLGIWLFAPLAFSTDYYLGGGPETTNPFFMPGVLPQPTAPLKLYIRIWELPLLVIDAFFNGNLHLPLVTLLLIVAPFTMSLVDYATSYHQKVADLKERIGVTRKNANRNKVRNLR